jgi:hypothetical protein
MLVLRNLQIVAHCPLAGLCCTCVCNNPWHYHGADSRDHTWHHPSIRTRYHVEDLSPHTVLVCLWYLLPVPSENSTWWPNPLRKAWWFIEPRYRNLMSCEKGRSTVLYIYISSIHVCNDSKVWCLAICKKKGRCIHIIDWLGFIQYCRNLICK